jgi:hypothetical protein
VPFYFVARLALDLGVFLFVMFIRKVFRSEDRWGVWLVAGIGACLLAGIGGSVWVGDWEGMLPISNPWFWPAWLAGLLAYAWMIAEGFSHYRRSRRRQSMGLCEAMICDRFQLWTIAGVIWLLVQGISVYQYIEYETTQEWGVFMNTLVGFFEIIPAVVTWLIFYPPAFYRDWVNRRYEVLVPYDRMGQRRRGSPRDCLARLSGRWRACITRSVASCSSGAAVHPRSS